MRGSVIYDSIILLGPDFGGNFERPISQSWGASYIKFDEEIGQALLMHFLYYRTRDVSN